MRVSIALGEAGAIYTTIHREEEARAGKQ